MRWYGDNSELNGIWNAKMPDILLFGGIAISDAEGRKLTDRIREVKRRYSEFGAFPIKWNFMDVERWFKNRSGEKTFSQLKAQSKQWRRSIIDCALDIEFTVIIACVKHHSVQRHVIKKTRSSVAQFAFADALMRVGLLATEVRPDGICVVLDWPDAGKYQVFTDEYRSALWKGTCHYSPGNSYFCGALHKLRFEEHIMFTKMEDCPLLQFSDLILGAVREFIDYALHKKPRDCLGVEITQKLVPKFRGYPSRIIGRGISVAASDSDFRNSVFKAMLRLRTS